MSWGMPLEQYDFQYPQTGPTMCSVLFLGSEGDVFTLQFSCGQSGLLEFKVALKQTVQVIKA